MVGSQFNRQRQYHLLKSRSVEIRDEEIQETKKYLAGLFHAWISEYLKKMGVAPILQRRKLRHREVKWCRQSYAGKLVTCLRLEHNLIIPQVPLLIFSSRLHLFTMPLSHSFSSLQNNAQSSLQHRKIVLSTLEIPPISQVSEPYKHLHICHYFETLLCSPTMLSPYPEEHTLLWHWCCAVLHKYTQT